MLFSGPGNAPYSDLKGFIAWAKSKDRVTYGSWGIASWGHLAGQILKRDLGLNMEHVPYKGDVPAITDVQNGALKAIAMTGPQRSASMPELATFTEQGVKNVDLAIWVGAYAPAGTPRPIIDRLQRELKAVINMPEVREKMVAQGQTPVGNTPEEFTANVRVDLPKWEALIKASGAKAE